MITVAAVTVTAAVLMIVVAGLVGGGTGMRDMVTADMAADMVTTDTVMVTDTTPTSEIFYMLFFILWSWRVFNSPKCKLM